MAILTTVFSFFIVFLTLVTSTEADPQIEVHPSEISLGLSSSLNINCSFSSMDHPEMAAFVSLILSKANSSGQKFEELAAITQFSPDSVTVLTQEKVTATGVHSQTGESFLHLTWDFPTATQAGVYQCVAHGMDILGDLVEVVNSSTVTVAQAGLNDIFEKLKEMEIHEMNMEKHIYALELNNSQMGSYITNLKSTVDGMEKNIQTLQNNNSQMSSYITNLENIVDGMEKNIQDLQNKNAQMSSNITDLQDTIASLQRCQPSNLELLGSYQNHVYCISREAYGDINRAINVCTSSGGYLTEIDDQNEFNAIKSFLNLTSGFDYAMIAGTDEAVDGTWILQSNQQPLPFTSWYTSGAHTGTGTNCLGLDRRRSWNMDDWGCNYDPPQNNYRFTCEIPRV